MSETKDNITEVGRRLYRAYKQDRPYHVSVEGYPQMYFDAVEPAVVGGFYSRRNRGPFMAGKFALAMLLPREEDLRGADPSVLGLIHIPGSKFYGVQTPIDIVLDAAEYVDFPLQADTVRL